MTEELNINCYALSQFSIECTKLYILVQFTLSYIFSSTRTLLVRFQTPQKVKYVLNRLMYCSNKFLKVRIILESWNFEGRISRNTHIYEGDSRLNVYMSTYICIYIYYLIHTIISWLSKIKFNITLSFQFPFVFHATFNMLFFSMRATCPPHLIRPDIISLIIFG
jgi:hypothetical protein